MNYSKQKFERLFKDSYPHMYRMAFSMVENADDAKDAVHQVFVQIWKRLLAGGYAQPVPTHATLAAVAAADGG